MSFVTYEAGNLKTTGKYCLYNAVLTVCETDGLEVSGGNLIKISTARAVGEDCIDLVVYHDRASGDLKVPTKRTCMATL